MNEDDLRLLIERTSTVDEMTETAGWELLKDRAAHTIGEHQRRVLGGKLTDLADYKRFTGFIEGAAFVLELPLQMQRELQAARERHAETEGDDAA